MKPEFIQCMYFEDHVQLHHCSFCWELHTVALSSHASSLDVAVHNEPHIHCNVNVYDFIRLQQRSWTHDLFPQPSQLLWLYTTRTIWRLMNLNLISRGLGVVALVPIFRGKDSWCINCCCIVHARVCCRASRESTYRGEAQAVRLQAAVQHTGRHPHVGWILSAEPEAPTKIKKWAFMLHICQWYDVCFSKC